MSSVASLAKTFRRVLAVVLVTGFMTCVFSQIYVEISYDYQMPAVPRPETGRIHRIRVNHGDVRYVSQKEFDRAHFIRYKLVLLEIALFAAFMILRVRYDQL
jgi:hypothetical protein